MARSVSLSDEAFATLRHDKLEGESDSDVVLRLHASANKKAKDPLAFFRNPPASSWTVKQYDDVRAVSRKLDLDRARKAGYVPREER